MSNLPSSSSAPKPKGKGFVLRKNRKSRNVIVSSEPGSMGAMPKSRPGKLPPRSGAELFSSELRTRQQYRGENTGTVEKPVARHGHKIILIPCCLVAIAIAIACGVSLANLALSDPAEWDGKVDQPAVELRNPALETSAVAPNQDFALVGKDRQFALDFLAAPTWEAKAALTRFPNRDLSLIEKFYQNRPSVAETPVAIRDTGISISGSTSFLTSVAKLKNGEMRVVAMVVGEDGAMAVDWKCFACENEVGWDELLAMPTPAEAAFRVSLTGSDYYNYRFQDAEQWACFELKRLGYSNDAFGYVKRNSEAHRSLEDLLKNRMFVRCMLKLRTTPDSPATRQFEVIEFMQSDWLERG